MAWCLELSSAAFGNRKNQKSIFPPNVTKIDMKQIADICKHVNIPKLDLDETLFLFFCCIFVFDRSWNIIKFYYHCYLLCFVMVILRFASAVLCISSWFHFHKSHWIDKCNANIFRRSFCFNHLDVIASIKYWLLKEFFLLLRILWVLEQAGLLGTDYFNRFYIK